MRLRRRSSRAVRFSQPKRKSAPKRQKKGILRGATQKVDDAIRTRPGLRLHASAAADQAPALARAGVSDEEFSSWLRDCSDILCEGNRPQIGDAQPLGRLGPRLDLAMHTPSMILLEPFDLEGLGACQRWSHAQCGSLF